MAEFTEIWNEWKRMCEYEQRRASCRTCPLSNLECNAKYPKDQNHYDGHAIEEIIMDWAEEHPELVYPTWREWLIKRGLIDFKPDFRSMTLLANSVIECLNEKASEPIPADIAKSLGLEPKEN